MKHHTHQKHVNIIKTLAHYGVHIWAILVIANASLAYAFHFSTQASNQQNVVNQEAEAPADGSPTPEESVQEEPTDAITPVVTKKPVGTTIDLAFKIPGVGSGSANMTPKRLQRSVTFFLYSPDANSLNRSVKPLYTVKTTANFDTNQLSPTYTAYVIKGFDFGGEIKKGNYQLTFRTDESLRTLIKENPENIGGKLFEFNRNARIQKLPLQTVYMGDTLPEEGDNTVDISDYNAFINCFGERSSDKSCTGQNYGDFDDNGVIDGVDYNLLLRTFSELLKQGQNIPKITAAPSGPARVSRLSNLTTPTKAPEKPEPTKPAAKATGSTGNVFGGILFFIFILIAGAVLFILFKKNPAFRDKVNALLHKGPASKPPAPTDPNTPQQGGATATPPVEAPQSTTPVTTPQATPTAPPAETPVDPNAIAASTEIPVGQQTPPPADPSAIAASTEIPVETQTATPAPSGEGTTEKSVYIKKIGPDESGTGVWLRLTDDNGAVEGHYTKQDAADGFAKVKGVMKTENDKTFMEIAEITPEG